MRAGGCGSGGRGRAEGGGKRAEAGNCNLVLPDSNVHARSRPSSPSPVVPVETRSDAQDRSVGRGQGARRPGTPRGARAQDKSTMRAARCTQVRSTVRAGVGALTIAHSRSSSSAIPSRLDVRARMPRRGRDRGLADRARLARAPVCTHIPGRARVQFAVLARDISVLPGSFGAGDPDTLLLPRTQGHESFITSSGRIVTRREARGGRAVSPSAQMQRPGAGVATPSTESDSSNGVHSDDAL